MSIDILGNLGGEITYMDIPVTTPPPHPSNQREKELVEIPNISNKPQLSEHVTPPTVNCESYTPPPMNMGQTVIGSGGTGKPVKITHDNDQPAGHGLTSSDQKGEEATP